MMRYGFELFHKREGGVRYRIFDRVRGLAWPIGSIREAHDAQMIVDALNQANTKLVPIPAPISLYPISVDKFDTYIDPVKI
jgi:hypothetical protein